MPYLLKPINFFDSTQIALKRKNRELRELFREEVREVVFKNKVPIVKNNLKQFFEIDDDDYCELIRIRLKELGWNFTTKFLKLK